MSARLRRATLAAALEGEAAEEEEDRSRRAGARADVEYGAGLQKVVDEAAVASVARGTRNTYGVA